MVKACSSHDYSDVINNLNRNAERMGNITTEEQEIREDITKRVLDVQENKKPALKDYEHKREWHMP